MPSKAQRSHVPVSMLVHNSEVVSEPSIDIAMGGHNRDEHVSSIRNTLDGDSSMKDESMKAPGIPMSASTLSSKCG